MDIKKIVDYKILIGSSVYNLESAVHAYLETGWKPVGRAVYVRGEESDEGFIGKDMWYQTMVMEGIPQTFVKIDNVEIGK